MFYIDETMPICCEKVRGGAYVARCVERWLGAVLISVERALIQWVDAGMRGASEYSFVAVGWLL